MMRRKVLGMAVLCLLLAGCGSAFQALTGPEKARTLCDEYLTQYEAFRADSEKIVASETASKDTKKFVIEKINPPLNKLRPLILDYCEVAQTGAMPSTDKITSIISDVTALIATVNQKGGKK